MSDVTRILSAIEHGDPSAAEQLLPLVYDELRQLAAQKLAQEKPGQTLDATALVHEAYLRLVGADPEQPWNSRGHPWPVRPHRLPRLELRPVLVVSRDPGSGAVGVTGPVPGPGHLARAVRAKIHDFWQSQAPNGALTNRGPIWPTP